MDALPYYKWYYRDFRASRKVRRMSWQARAHYRELLDEFWDAGFLPVDRRELADICDCTLEELDAVWPEIEPCWEERNGKLFNTKMDAQRTEKDAQRAKNAANGSAGAKQKLANASDRQADAEHSSSERHIALAEQEHTHKQEQRNTLASTADAVPAEKPKKASREKKEPDPRHVPFKLACETYAKYKRVVFTWDGSEAKALDLLLQAAPELSLAEFQACINHRARSPGTPHGERPRVWLPHALRYQQGPLNEFNRIEESNGTRGISAFGGKTARSVDAAQQAIDELASRARAIAQNGGDSPAFSQAGNSPPDEAGQPRLLSSG